MNQESLIDYYAKRANEYEKVYHKPERQEDLYQLEEHLKTELTGRNVLEMACGTGFWTARVAAVVRSIVATDINEEVLAIARAKDLGPDRVAFKISDAYTPRIAGEFDAGLACFWWSHIPLNRLTEFLRNFHSSLQPVARVTFVDNRFVPGSSTPISNTDTEGNTYQTRHLSDGSSHQVLKNFPMVSSIIHILGDYSKSITVTEFDYFWSVTYTLDSARRSIRPDRPRNGFSP